MHHKIFFLNSLFIGKTMRYCLFNVFILLSEYFQHKDYIEQMFIVYFSYLVFIQTVDESLDLFNSWIISHKKRILYFKYLKSKYLCKCL